MTNVNVLTLQVWQLRGRYPNRGYPKIFNDPTVGSEARKLFEEAQEMLRDFVENKRVRLNGIVGFYPANSVGDDIEVYSDESRSEVRHDGLIDMGILLQGIASR